MGAAILIEQRFFFKLIDKNHVIFSCRVYENRDRKLCECVLTLYILFCFLVLQSGFIDTTQFIDNNVNIIIFIWIERMYASVRYGETTTTTRCRNT